MSTVVVINTKYTYIKYIFILIGMALWINAPILGIFPILLFVFLNHNSDEEYDQNSSNNVIVNNFLLLLVVLTLTFFCALVDIQADTLEYVNEYQQCRNINPVECFQSRPYPFEPGFYLLSYVFFSISNGSNLGFLLLWSFVTNVLAVFFICKKISPRYYALVIFFMILNPAFYTQTFLMRQFISVTFLLCGLLDEKNKTRSILFCVMSVLTHYYSITIIVFMFLSSYLDQKLDLLTRIRRTKIGKFLFFLMCTIASLSIINISSVSNFLVSINQIAALSFLTEKLNYFLNRDLENIGFGFHLIIGIVIGFYSINLRSTMGMTTGEYGNTNLKRKNRYDILMSYLYFDQFILFLLARNLDYLPMRLSLLFVSYAGIFLYLPLERESQISKSSIKNSLIFLGFCLFSYYVYFLDRAGASPFNYLDGHPLTSSIIDYINLATARW